MAKMKPQTLERCIEICDTLPVKYSALAALGISTGGRIAEILTLRRRDLITDSGDLREEIQILQVKQKRKASTYQQIKDLTAQVQQMQSEIIRLQNVKINMFGEDIGNPPRKPAPRSQPKQPARRYRTLAMPAELAGYIIAHLNADARRGYIRPDDYVFRGRNPGTPLNTRAAYRAFTRHLGAGYGTHWLRKSYAHLMYDLFKDKYGGDSYRAAREVQQLLGHKSIETTARYLCLDNTTRAETVRDFFHQWKAAQE